MRLVSTVEELVARRARVLCSRVVRFDLHICVSWMRGSGIWNVFAESGSCLPSLRARSGVFFFFLLRLDGWVVHFAVNELDGKKSMLSYCCTIWESRYGKLGSTELVRK